MSIGDVAVDFHSAVDWAGVHDEAGWLELCGAGFGEAEERDVFAEAGEVFLALALVLDPQEVHDIHFGEDIVEAVSDADAEFFKAFRDQRGRAYECHFGAEFEEAENVGAGDAAEEDVTDDGNMESLDAAKFFPDGEDVEETLRGMFVSTVAGVDDAGVEALREESGRAWRAVAENDDVRLKGLEVEGGVLECLAFLEAGGCGGDVHYIRAKAHGCDLERCPGAGAWLDEEIHERLSPERGHFFQAALADAFECTRRIKEEVDLGGGEFVESGEVFSGPDAHGLMTTTESGTPSRFSKRTRIFSSREVGRFFPT